MWLAPLHRPRAVLTAPRGDGPQVLFFSPDSRDLLTSRSLAVWDLAAGTRRVTLEGGAADINSFAWSPDGTHIAGRHLGGGVLIWDRESGKLQRELGDYGLRETLPNTQIIYSPDNRLLFQQAPNTTEMWDIETKQSVLDLRQQVRAYSLEHSQHFPGVFYARLKNKEIAIRLDTGEAIIIDAVSGEFGEIGALSPDGRSYTAWVRRGPVSNVWIWTPRGRRELPPIAGLNLANLWAIPRLAVSNDARYLAVAASEQPLKWIFFGEPVGDYRNRVRLLYPETGRSAGNLNDVDSVAFSPDSNTLAAIKPNGAIELWDLPLRTPFSWVIGASAAAATLAYGFLSWRGRRKGVTTPAPRQSSRCPSPRAD
jgi:WD40 domain-containing protein